MVQQVLKYKATMHRLKPMFLSQLTLHFNNLVLTSYWSVIYLESWFSWLWEGVQKALRKKKKTDRRKTLKIQKKEKRTIRAKSNNNIIHLLF